MATPSGPRQLCSIRRIQDVMLSPTFSEINDYNNGAVGFEPKAGTMVMFRSHVKHSVKTSQIDGERISVAFNLRF